MGNVFVITHKEFHMDLPENYLPIQVGKINTKLELGYTSDDTGENIAHKNANYCELTGLYWVWKNYNIKDYVGFCHYRRYLISNNKLLSDNKIKELLKEYDVILPKKMYFGYSVGENYYKGGAGKKEDLEKLRNIVLNTQKDYIDSFDKVVNGYGAHYCNIFIMNKENFNNYMKWLFEILEKLEEQLDLSTYTKMEARIYGFLSEILLDVWIRKNNLKFCECKVLQTELKLKTKVRNNLKNTYYKLIRGSKNG